MKRTKRRKVDQRGKCQRLSYAVPAVLLLILAIRYGVGFAVGEYDIPKRWQDICEETIVIEGVVTGKEDHASSRVFYLSDHLLVYDSDFADIRIGSKVRILGEANSFSKQRNAGGFDEETYYRGKKYWAKLYAERITVEEEGRSGFKERLFQCRKYWSDFLQSQLGREKGSILAAMLLGDKGRADAEEKEWYQKAGLGHLLAISGFHVGFFGALFFAAFRNMRIPFSGAAVLTGIVLWFYVLLCNVSASALRAYIMYMVYLGAGMAGRAYQGMRALFLSAVLILLLHPMDIQDAGFLLSFSAMFGIQVLYPLFTNRISENQYRKGWTGRKRDRIKAGLWGRLLDGLLLTAAVQIMILPLILYFYFEIPVYSFTAGLAVTGLFSILMASGAAGCLLGTWQSWCCKISLLPAEKILDFYSWICRKELQLPCARWVAGQPELWQMVLYYMLLVMVVLLCKKWKKRRFLLLCILLPGLMVHFPERNRLLFHMVDVGQGDCFVIEGPEGGTYMVDGGSSDQSEPARYIIEPFLKSMGIAKVDYVFLTHGDEDHVCGVLEMMEREKLGVEIGNLVLPTESVWDDTLREAASLAESMGIRVIEMSTGDFLTEGDMKLRALYPETGSQFEAGNDASLILDLRYRKFSALLTGDLGEEGEKRLMEEETLRSYTVLKAGHHGSKYASSAEFLEQIKPLFVLISAGINNRYGHPAWEMLERAKEAGAKILRTDQSGGVTIRTDGEQLTFDPNIRVCYDNSQ